MRWLARLIATGLYTGFSPVAPGTVGSLIAAALLWFLPPFTDVTFLFMVFLLFVVGLWSSTLAEEEYGHDAGRINIDEIVGMLLSLMFLPKTPVVFGCGFLLFRFFDVLKPFPIRRSQRLPKGWGVMIDDVIAGIYTNLVLRIGLAIS